MSSGQLTAIIIVAIVMISLIIRSESRPGGRFHHRDPADDETRAENKRLRNEVQELKERLKVIERITVEKENSLSRQIEELRDR